MIIQLQSVIDFGTKQGQETAKSTMPLLWHSTNTLYHFIKTNKCLDKTISSAHQVLHLLIIDKPSKCNLWKCEAYIPVVYKTFFAPNSLQIKQGCLVLPRCAKMYTYRLFVWYGGLLLALYNYNGLVAPGLSLYNFWFSFDSVCFCVLGLFPAALSHTVRLVRRLQHQFIRSW